MGREIKRVPVDFDWPLGETWEGFWNPFRAKFCSKCPECNGRYFNPETAKLSDAWYGFDQMCAMDYLAKYGYNPVDGIIKGKEFQETEQKAAFAKMTPVDRSEFLRLIQNPTEKERNRGWQHRLEQDEVDALVRAGRLHDITHDCTRENGWRPKPEYAEMLTALSDVSSLAYRLKTEARELRKTDPEGAKNLRKKSRQLERSIESMPIPKIDPEVVNAWSKTGMGHDGINQHVCLKVRGKRLGVYGHCPKCHGEGVVWTCNAAEKYLAKKYKTIEPPKGDGWQMWETVSEGSPVSPVFDSPEGLINWLASPAAGRERTSLENASRFVSGPGWTPSMISGPTKLHQNLETMELMDKPKEG